MSSLIAGKFFSCCSLSSLSVKAIFMATVVLLAGFEVQQQVNERPPSLLFCWEETNPLVNITEDVTICDLNHDDDKFPSCQLPPRKAFVELLEMYKRMGQTFLNVDLDEFKSFDKELFEKLAKLARAVREGEAMVQENLDREARKIRICDRNETEIIFRLALVIVLIDFLGLALDGFLTIASTGRVWTPC